MDLVIFDMDGVLVDSEIIAARIATRALNQAGYQTDETDVLTRFLGISNVSMLKIVERDSGIRLTDAFLVDLRRDLLAAYEGELQAIPGVDAALGSLTARRCVASSSNPDRIGRSLELTGLSGHFGTDIFSATMVENGKPAPDLFLYAATQMGADPARCVVIEDSEAGVTGAKAAGMAVLGFTGGSHVTHHTHAPKLSVAGADRVFDDMSALLGLIAEAAA